MSETATPLHLAATGKTDAERAAVLKEKVAVKLYELLAVMDEAATEGFRVQFNIGSNSLGRNHIERLALTKEY